MKGMHEIIHSLPEQIAETLNIFKHYWKSRADKKIHNRRFNRVLICGMGGSGISGEITQVLYPDIDVIVNKDYHIPEYIDKDTLAILVSYSGNTEETLNNYKELKKKRVPIITITTNGKLLKNYSLLKIIIPAGYPPRGALGYLFTPIPLLLYKLGLVKKNPEQSLYNLATFLKREAKGMDKKGKILAQKLINKLPVIYANSTVFAIVANRWRCQLNENAKTLCHTNIIPEMNHNEIVGLGRPVKLNKDMIIIFLNDPYAHFRNRLRVKIIKGIIAKEIKGLNVIDINPAGKNLLENTFWTIMLGDFLSYYLAIDAHIEPLPVERINYLKQRLSKAR